MSRLDLQLWRSFRSGLQSLQVCKAWSAQGIHRLFQQVAEGAIKYNNCSFGFLPLAFAASDPHEHQPLVMVHRRARGGGGGGREGGGGGGQLSEYDETLLSVQPCLSKQGCSWAGAWWRDPSPLVTATDQSAAASFFIDHTAFQ